MARRGQRYRYRAAGKAIIADSGRGPLRLAIEASGPALAVYSKRDRREIIQKAMAEAGDLWVKVFLPKRFSNYAARHLGYPHKNHGNDAASFSPAGVQLIQNDPLVDTGLMGTRAMSAARTKVIGATGQNPRIQIRFPQTRPLKAKYKAVLLRVPAHEVKRIAKRVETNIARLATRGATAKQRKPVGGTSRGDEELV